MADLGFAGRVSRNVRIYPSYNVFAGSVVGDGQTSLPLQLGEVAAKDLPGFANDILTLFYENQSFSSFRSFIEHKKTEVQEIVSKYSKIPSYEDRSAEAIRFLAKGRKTNNLYSLKGGLYAWADEVDGEMQKY